jgi:hypothetical protein
MTWPQLKEALLNLTLSDQPVKVARHDTIIDEALFLKSHIAVVDRYPKVDPPTHANNRARLLIAKPHFDRLMAYYLIKTQL